MLSHFPWLNNCSLESSILTGKNKTHLLKNKPTKEGYFGKFSKWADSFQSQDICAKVSFSQLSYLPDFPGASSFFVRKQKILGNSTQDHKKVESSCPFHISRMSWGGPWTPRTRRVLEPLLMSLWLNLLLCQLGECNSYAVFHNKILSEKNPCTTSLFLCIGNWKELSWVVLAQGLLLGCRQGVSQGCNHLKARLGLKDVLPKRLPHMNSRLRQLERSEDMTTWLPPELVMRTGGIERGKEGDGSRSIFYNLISEVAYQDLFFLFLYSVTHRDLY